MNAPFSANRESAGPANIASGAMLTFRNAPPPGLVARLATCLAFGLVVWLAVAPFTATADDAPPAAATTSAAARDAAYNRLAAAIADVRDRLDAERAAFEADRARIDAARLAARQAANDARVKLDTSRRLIVDARTQTQRLRNESTALHQRLAAARAVQSRLGNLLASREIEIAPWRAVLATWFPVGPAAPAVSPATAPTTAPLIDERLARHAATAAEVVRAGAAVEYRPNQTTFPESGTATPANALRIGLFGGVYAPHDGAAPGVFRFSREAPHLQFASVGVSAAQQRAIRDTVSANGTGGTVMLDLTDGAALRTGPSTHGLRATFVAGGAVAWPLAAMAILGVLMVIERTISLTRVRLSSDRLEHDLPPLLRAGDFAGALAALTGSDGPLQRVWRRGIALLRDRAPNVEESLQEAMLAEIPLLERFLSTLAVFAVVAPLLGLLGTVTGMIKTFEAITQFGSGDPKVFSSGISEALVSTEIGLIVAIPALLAHAILSRQSRLLVARLDQAALVLLESAGRHAASSDAPADGLSPAPTAAPATSSDDATA